MTATIECSSKFTTVENDKTATLGCKGQVMKTDIVVEFETAGAIKYNGQSTSCPSGSKATLACSGKLMTDDVVVDVSSLTNLDPVDDSIVGTWVLKQGWTVTAGLGQYEIEGSRHYDTSTYIHPVNMICLGFDSSLNPVANSIVFVNDSSNSGFTNNDVSLTVVFTITGGADINNETLKSWLKANATKQATPTTISFTIDGTSYQAEEGMTFGEWIESDYNTGGFNIIVNRVALGNEGSYKPLVPNASKTTIIENGVSYSLGATQGGAVD